MNDTTIRNKAANDAGDSVLKPMKEAADQVATKVQEKGQDLTDRAARLAESSIGTIKDKASEMLDATKNVAGEAGDRIQTNINAQKDAGARYVESVAESLRRAAREFENEIPIASTYILGAASAFDTVAGHLKDGDVQQLVTGTKDFAKRQPTLFFGIAMLAGFGAVRFLKSSSEPKAGADSKAASQA